MAKKDGIQGRAITHREAMKGLGDPKTWERNKEALMKEFRKKPDTRPRPDYDRLISAEFNLRCSFFCLATKVREDRATAARHLRDAAYILYEQAERIMQDGYRPEFLFLSRGKKS